MLAVNGHALCLGIVDAPSNCVIRNSSRAELVETHSFCTLAILLSRIWAVRAPVVDPLESSFVAIAILRARAGTAIGQTLATST
jgi:hypothetical protein